MKILLIGYGKMGKAIEKVAIERGHTISGIVGESDNIRDIESSEHDVAIEFTQPEAAINNIKTCFGKGLPIVSGTTGWIERMDEIKKACIEQSATFFYASNFSLGVNLFFMLNEYFAKLMSAYGDDYSTLIDEIHHTEKKDSPSGTAISIAEGIIQNHEKLDSWSEYLNNSDFVNNEVPIRSFREEQVPGTHLVKYKSEIDTIELKHTAHSRTGFALGAVIAAEWVKDKTGAFGMKDLLSEPTTSDIN